jgi:DNA-directed RNA polymerase subunit RPC12/RpoP
MTDRSKLIARCTLCASEFSQDDLDGVNACPVCGHGGLPMPIDADVKVAVNWHELRILGMWAENWAVQHKEKHPEMQRVVGVICGRLHAQHPKRSGLTMTAEMGEVRRAFPDNEVENKLPRRPGGG